MPYIWKRRACPPLVAIFGLTLLIAGCEPSGVEGKRVGDRCPPINGRDVDGKPIRLDEYAGKVVLINFWGTWCPPCRAMLPHEREMVAKYQGRPFVLFGIAQDSAETLKEFQQKNPLPWPNIVDGSRVLSQSWGVEGFPAAVLVDHKGVIRKLWLDGLNPKEVWDEVDKAVQAAESP